MTRRELSGRQKLEIIRLFFRGEGYAEIAQQTDTSKGSVHNVVNELREGRFTDIARPDEIDLLRDLAVSLKKAGLDVYNYCTDSSGMGDVGADRELMEKAKETFDDV